MLETASALGHPQSRLKVTIQSLTLRIHVVIILRLGWSTGQQGDMRGTWQPYFPTTSFTWNDNEAPLALVLSTECVLVRTGGQQGTLTLGRQGDFEFRINLGYIARSCLKTKTNIN